MPITNCYEIMVVLMPAHRKVARNKELVEDRDINGMTFPELGKKYGVRKWTAWEIYKREKAREDEAEEQREAMHRDAA